MYQHRILAYKIRMEVCNMQVINGESSYAMGQLLNRNRAQFAAEELVAHLQIAGFDPSAGKRRKLGGVACSWLCMSMSSGRLMKLETLHFALVPLIMSSDFQNPRFLKSHAHAKP